MTDTNNIDSRKKLLHTSLGEAIYFDDNDWMIRDVSDIMLNGYVSFSGYVARSDCNSIETAFLPVCII